MFSFILPLAYVAADIIVEVILPVSWTVLTGTLSQRSPGTACSETGNKMCILLMPFGIWSQKMKANLINVAVTEQALVLWIDLKSHKSNVE